MTATEERLSITEDPESLERLTDEELTALAMSGNTDEPLDADALPIDIYLANTVSPLPEWYMAPVMTRNSGRFARVVILAVITSFLLIEAFGLCSTFGQLPFH